MVAASHEICSRECSGSGYNSSNSRIRNKRRPRISTDDISPARTIWSILASEIRIGLANAAARKPKLIPSVDKTKVTLDHFVMVRIHGIQLYKSFTISYLRFIYFYVKSVTLTFVLVMCSLFTSSRFQFWFARGDAFSRPFFLSLCARVPFAEGLYFD